MEAPSDQDKETMVAALVGLMHGQVSTTQAKAMLEKHNYDISVSTFIQRNAMFSMCFCHCS